MCNAFIPWESEYSYTRIQADQSTPKTVATHIQQNKTSGLFDVMKKSRAIAVNENGAPVVQTLDSELKHGADDTKTFDDVLNSDATTATTQSIEGSEITTVTNDDNNTVAAFSVSDNESGASVSIVNDGTNIVVTKSTIDSSTGQAKTETQSFALQNTSGTAQAMAWSSWGYTNIAVGARVFGYAVDTAIIGLGTAAATACLPGAIAAAMGCSVAAARGFVSFTVGVVFGYLATIKSPGQWLAGKLDTNHNGWIGIYYRYNPSTGAHQWKTI